MSTLVKKRVDHQGHHWDVVVVGFGVVGKVLKRVGSFIYLAEHCGDEQRFESYDEAVDWVVAQHDRLLRTEDGADPESVTLRMASATWRLWDEGTLAGEITLSTWPGLRDIHIARFAEEQPMSFDTLPEAKSWLLRKARGEI